MFYVIELQTTGGTGASIVQTRETLNEAMSLYHSILSFAATSTVEHHACVVVDEQGRYIARECYDHAQPTVITDEGGE